MSVTFSPELGPLTGYTFTCGHEDALTEHRFGTYQDAEEFLRTELDAHGNTGHLAVCGDDYCAASRMFIIGLEAEESPEVNISDVNGCHVLGLLGYECGDLSGSDTAEGFLGRVLVALAVNPFDAGVPATTTVGGRIVDGHGAVALATGPAPTGATVVDCGRRPGYSGDVLERLRGVADWAAERGRPIRWG